MNCYNCNIELGTHNRTKEHIPAKNLFLDIPYKDNITVDACRECNHQYSKIDFEVRDAIAVCSNIGYLPTLTEKGVRSIIRNGKTLERLNIDEYGSVTSVNFDKTKLDAFHIKNFKGLFYHTFRHSIPLNYRIDVISDGEKKGAKIEIATIIFNLADEELRWQKSGDERIFKYKLHCLAKDGYNNVKLTLDLNKSFLIFAIIIYHEKLCSIVVAARSSYITKVASKKGVFKKMP